MGTARRNVRTYGVRTASRMVLPLAWITDWYTIQVVSFANRSKFHQRTPCQLLLDDAPLSEDQSVSFKKEDSEHHTI